MLPFTLISATAGQLIKISLGSKKFFCILILLDDKFLFLWKIFPALHEFCSFWRSIANHFISVFQGEKLEIKLFDNKSTTR